MATHKPIAVLLAYPTDMPSSAARPEPGYYADLFLHDPESLNRFWNDASDRAIDLEGTQVFGWRSHGMTRAAFQGLNRARKIKQAVDVFVNASDAAQRVDLSRFVSVAVFGDSVDDVGTSNQMFNLQGAPKYMGGSIFDIGTDYRLIAHETGHGFGFDHSFNDSSKPIDPADDGRPGAYGDSYDVMSAAHVLSFVHPRFGLAGPGLNTVMRDIAGWLDPSRIVDGRALNGPAVIYDAYDPAPGHPHVLRVDEYSFEFRMNTGWDRGFGAPGVQVRIRTFDKREHSKLLRFSGAAPVLGGPKYNMGVGDSFVDGHPFSVFERYLEVTVEHIDPGSGSAALGVRYRAARPIPFAGPGITIGGADVGGGSLFIVGGHIYRIPPNSPLIGVLESLGILASVEHLGDPNLREQVAGAAIASIEAQTKSLKAKSTG